MGNLHPLTKQLLYNRNYIDQEDVRTFLDPEYENGLHSPWLLHDMDIAVTRILHAVTNNETIVIFSDYDCDGIPGAVVLHDLFTMIGYAHIVQVIPHRHFDGFGLSVKLVERMHEAHSPALIITVDCGTSDSEAIARAHELGIDVIVTDHHEPPELLPTAVAVVNPKLHHYPFPDLCGAAVAFKVARAVLERGEYAVPPGSEKWLLDMVGLATIADMVPLVGENRVLAHYGLIVLRKSRRPGLQQLLRAQRTDPRYLTEDDIGFTIGPRVNAASRMDAPEDAFHLLATKDEGLAGGYVTHLERLNTERKVAGTRITKDIHQRLQAQPDLPPVLVLVNPEWRPSLVGLSANKLAEEYNRPVFLWGRDGNGVYKGSCRSGGGVSVVVLMEAARDVFREFGGHHFSGGFTVRDERIHTLKDTLLTAYDTLKEAAIVRNVLHVDAKVTLEDITPQFIEAQSRLAPFGVGNPKPLYLIEGVTPKVVTVFGKAKEHTRVTFATSGIAKEAIAFFKRPEHFLLEPKEGVPLSLLVHIEQSFFMGRRETRLRIVDVLQV
jgi:single-stranded-DNA-specific exonuclease